MSPAAREREVEKGWRGKHWQALNDPTTALDIEGSLRSGKTTLALWMELRAMVAWPGLHTILSRWTEDATHALLKPVWRAILAEAGVRATWHPEEHYDEISNGSRAYIRGLKAQDAHSRYGKFRGLTLARAYIDQAEELPGSDIYLELKARLSQKNIPHQIVITPQAVEETHWIAKEFPENNSIEGRHYYGLSVYDNAHNLDAITISDLEGVYPHGHPKRRTLIEGRRGMSVIGDPVYAGAFNRRIHEVPLAYNPALPLYEAYDFGKHHPCWIIAQFPLGGGIQILAGILGQDLWLEDFLPVVQGYRTQWFPKIQELRTCCDPAGSHEGSGLRHNAISNLRAAYPEGHAIEFKNNSNAPDVRVAMVERLAGQMRRRTPWGEAFGIDGTKDDYGQPVRWLRVSAQGPVAWSFLADGCEAGYVWDEHYVSVGSKQVRKPKKDGWYEHGENCLEYLELNFGGGQATAAEEEARARQRRAAEEAAKPRAARSPETGTGWMG